MVGYSSRPDFPSFSEGLSLRVSDGDFSCGEVGFPFLFGGTFIEGISRTTVSTKRAKFPFLFGGTFIEGFQAPTDRWV